jgi:hypothetical protein
MAWQAVFTASDQNRSGVLNCNALNLVVEFFLLFSHQIQALLFPSSLFFSLSLDLFQSRSGFSLSLDLFPLGPAPWPPRRPAPPRARPPPASRARPCPRPPSGEPSRPASCSAAPVPRFDRPPAPGLARPRHHLPRHACSLAPPCLARVVTAPAWPRARPSVPMARGFELG